MFGVNCYVKYMEIFHTLIIVLSGYTDCLIPILSVVLSIQLFFISALLRLRSMEFKKYALF